jgi:hypothetical protein
MNAKLVRMLLIVCPCAAGLWPAAARAEGVTLKEAIRQVSRDGDTRKAQRLARAVAAGQGREVVPDVVEALFEEYPTRQVQFFLAMTLAELADPKDRRGLKTRTLNGASGGRSPEPMAMALLAALGDDRAKKLLVRLATERPPAKSYRRVQVCVHAAGLLRSLGDAETLKAVDRALEKDLGQEQEEGLRALKDSFTYRAKLKDEKLRAKYLEFERSLWTSIAFSPKNARFDLVECLTAAGALQEELGRVDVRFLRRVFDTVVPEVEFRVVCLLIARQNETSLKPMLKNLLESDGGFGAHLRDEFAQAEKKQKKQR